MDLLNRYMRPKLTNNGCISFQNGFICSYAVPIAQNKEKDLIRMPKLSMDRDFIVFLYIFIYGFLSKIDSRYIGSQYGFKFQIGLSSSKTK